MQISRTTSLTNSSPFNRIFESYGDILSIVFEARHDIDPKTTYVHLPVIEQEITDFALSGSQDIGLLVGDVGIGKSSVLKYIRESRWPTPICRVLFKDLSEDSMSINLPADFFELPLKTQRQYANKLANKKVLEMINTEIRSWLWADIKSKPELFYNFIEEWYPEYLPDDALFSSDQPNKILKKFKKKNKNQYFRCSLHYYLQRNDIQHVKFVIDNLDDKDSLITYSIIEIAAHLARGIKKFSDKERKVNSDTPERWMTTVIACRPNTADSIIHKDTRNGNGWHGFRELSIKEPCSLSQAIKKRYHHIVKSKSLQNKSDRALRFTLGSVPWNIEDRDRFFEGMCDAFDTAGQSSKILALCNNNVADTMGAILNVTRNRHFVKIEPLVAASYPTNTLGFNEYAKEAFTRTTILRSLAYGNQGDVTPVYPVQDTPVVNMLHSHFIPFGQSSFKIRVIGMFIHLKSKSGADSVQMSLRHICDMGVKFFEISRETSQSVIDEMFKDGLLGNSRIVGSPSTIGQECQLSLQPRAALLWRLLSEDSILLQCYRDNSELDIELKWNEKIAQFQNRPSLEMPIEEVARELVWMLRQFWVREKAELDNLAKKSLYEEFTEFFGEELVSERLLQGVENSRKKFYNRISNLDNEVYQADLLELTTKIQASKEKWTR